MRARHQLRFHLAIASSFLRPRCRARAKEREDKYLGVKAAAISNQPSHAFSLQVFLAAPVWVFLLLDSGN
jgi:hypothetical protein